MGVVDIFFVCYDDEHCEDAGAVVVGHEHERRECRGSQPR